MNDWQLWGTFAVTDHLRKHAFVADVVLFDRLVIPTPPVDDSLELARWAKKWQPERQSEILEILRSVDPTCVVAVPWTADIREHFSDQYRAAQAAAGDVTNIQHAVQRLHDQAGLHERRATTRDLLSVGVPQEELDSLSMYTSRSVLKDKIRSQVDTNLMLGVPAVDISVVPAFGSYARFASTRDVAVSDVRGDLALFGARLLVPAADVDISPLDVLRRAAEYAQSAEVREHRIAYHRWRRSVLQSGIVASDAEARLQAAIDECASYLSKRKWRYRSRFALAVLAVGTGVAGAFGLAALAAGSAFVGFGQWVAGEAVARDTEHAPPGMEFAAMFHDARRQLGWTS